MVTGNMQRTKAFRELCSPVWWGDTRGTTNHPNENEVASACRPGGGMPGREGDGGPQGSNAWLGLIVVVVVTEPTSGMFTGPGCEYRTILLC